MARWLRWLPAAAPALVAGRDGPEEGAALANMSLHDRLDHWLVGRPKECADGATSMVDACCPSDMWSEGDRVLDMLRVRGRDKERTEAEMWPIMKNLGNYPIMPKTYSEKFTDVSTLPPVMLNFSAAAFEVQVSVHIPRLWAVNSREQSFMAQVEMAFRWRDCRLLHHHIIRGVKGPSRGLPAVVAPFNDQYYHFWTMHAEVRSADLQRKGESRVDRKKVDFNGEVTQTLVMEHTIPCQFDFQDLPYDEHTCEIVIWNPTYLQEELRLLPSDSPLSTRATSAGEFHIQGWEVQKGSYPPVGGGGSERVSALVLRFKLRRNPRNLLNTFVAPCMVAWALSYLGLWVDPACPPARITLGSVPMLMLINKQNALIGVMPLMEDVSRLEEWVRTTIIMAGLHMCEYVVVETALLYIRRAKDRSNARDEGVGDGPLSRRMSASQRFHGVMLNLRRWTDFHARWIFLVTYLIICLMYLLPPH